jgi:hypothetical protein
MHPLIYILIAGFIRLHVNRPPFVTNEVVFILWLLYLISVGVYYVSVRISDRTTLPR